MEEEVHRRRDKDEEEQRGWVEKNAKNSDFLRQELFREKLSNHREGGAEVISGPG